MAYLFLQNYILFHQGIKRAYDNETRYSIDKRLMSLKLNNSVQK